MAIQYAMESSAAGPFWLARMDMSNGKCESISLVNKTWTPDRDAEYMFYDSSGDWIDEEEAARVASALGATL